MRTSIIFITLFAIASCGQQNSFMNTPDLSREDTNAYSPKTCYPKVISSYGPQIDEYNERNSMVPSARIAEMCTNFHDSCCLDSEFNEMLAEAQLKVDKLVTFRASIYRAIDMAASWSTGQRKDLYKAAGDEFFQEFKGGEADFNAVFDMIKANRKVIKNNFKKAFNTFFNYSAGLPCAICEAKNHASFIGGEKRDDLKMVMDTNMCENLFNSEELLGLIACVRDIGKITFINQLLGRIYKLNVGSVDIAEFDTKWTQIDNMRQSCLASQDSFVDNNQCLELCFETGSFNENLSSGWVEDFMTFINLADDFFGDNAMLKSLSAMDQNNETPMDNNNETPSNDPIKMPRMVITDNIELLTVKYFVDPKNHGESNGFNFNNIKYELRKGDGWNLNDVRVKAYVGQNFAALFGFCKFALFAFATMIM